MCMRHAPRETRTRLYIPIRWYSPECFACPPIRSSSGAPPGPAPAARAIPVPVKRASPLVAKAKPPREVHIHALTEPRTAAHRTSKRRCQQPPTPNPLPSQGLRVALAPSLLILHFELPKQLEADEAHALGRARLASRDRDGGWGAVGADKVTTDATMVPAEEGREAPGAVWALQWA